jgi:prepilin-type N-terminal cleavage/methylation domain-containing protein
MRLRWIHPSTRRSLSREDAGFSLIEVMVALTILAIVTALAATTLISTLGSTSDDRARVAAANLASRELAFVRAAFESPTQGPQSIPLGQVVNGLPLPGGTAGNPLVVDNRSYTVTRTTEWQAQGASSGPCDGGASGQLAYMRVGVLVTWKGIGKTTPVTSATLLTPPLGTYDAGTGHIKAKIIDDQGAPEAGTTVTVTSGASTVDVQQTASDGCAFFGFLDPGTYTVTVSRAGYIDQSWSPTTSQSVTVVANSVASASFAYAAAATTIFNFDTSQPAYAPATATALTVYNPAITGSTQHVKTYPSSVPTRTLTTWPYSDGLVAWSGDCTDADPGISGGSRPAPTASGPGQTVTSLVQGAAVAVIVKRGTAVQTGLTVEAVHSTTGCPTTVKDPFDGTTTVGEVLRLPVTTDSTGTARVLLPFGTWTLKVLTKTATSWPVINLLSNATFPATYQVSIS